MKGTKYQPGTIDVGASKRASNAVAVERAFKTSGLTLEQWDAQTDDAREAKITVAIAELRAINMTALAETRDVATSPGDDVAVDQGAPQV